MQHCFVGHVQVGTPTPPFSLPVLHTRSSAPARAHKRRVLPSDVAHRRCALVADSEHRPATSQQNKGFTTDELDVVYFGEDGDPDARITTAGGSEDDAEEGVSSEESLALSEAEQLFTVPDFLSSAHELRAHFDER